MQVLAEVSVTLLGFSGITAVMGHSRFDQRGVAYRMQGLLYTSSLALVGSVLPLVGVPILPAAISIAALSSAGHIWAGKILLGRSKQQIQFHPVLLWTFLPIGVIATLPPWWVILTLSEQLLVIYQLLIGYYMLTATTYFGQVVGSAFGSKDTPGKD